MNRLSKADQFLLDSIKRGDERSWNEFVERFQGRLLAFARQRLRDSGAAEDVVQETFIACLRGLQQFRGDSGLETYLFVILRRKIIDHLRGRKLNLCLLQDTLGGEDDSYSATEALAVDPVTGASWYAKGQERQEAQHGALTTAVTETIEKYKDALDFRALMLTELLFYCGAPAPQIASMMDEPEPTVRTFKRRWLQRIAARAQELAGEEFAQVDADTWRTDEHVDSLLRDTWQTQRLSCPKRNTIGAYLLGSLDEAWSEYVGFHIEHLGCHFCRANLDDLKAAADEAEQQRLHERILNSTVGFLKQA